MRIQNAPAQHASLDAAIDLFRGHDSTTDPNRYAPDLDEHRLDTGQGWIEQSHHFH